MRCTNIWQWKKYGLRQLRTWACTSVKYVWAKCQVAKRRFFLKTFFLFAAQGMTHLVLTVKSAPSFELPERVRVRSLCSKRGYISGSLEVSQQQTLGYCARAVHTFVNLLVPREKLVWGRETLAVCEKDQPHRIFQCHPKKRGPSLFLVIVPFSSPCSFVFHHPTLN